MEKESSYCVLKDEIAKFKNKDKIKNKNCCVIL